MAKKAAGDKQTRIPKNMKKAIAPELKEKQEEMKKQGKQGKSDGTYK